MTSQKIEKTPKQKAEDREDRKFLFGIGFVIFSFILFAVGKHLNATDVIKTENAGVAVNANYDTGIIINTTKVETTTGVFLVNGTVSINKGDGLTLQTRRNKDKYLCVEKTGECRSLYN